MNKKLMWSTVAALVIVVAGVVITLQSNAHQKTNQAKKEQSMSGMNMFSDSMKMSSSSTMQMKMDGKLPEGLATAQDPKYKVGQEITLKATHMANMKNAKGTIAAVYDTKLYAVDYMPTNGGSMVKDHKWLTMIDFTDKMAHKVGDEVTLDSDHMAGMQGAKAKIVQVENGPAYAVNYQPTDGGQRVMNHLYLAQDEIQARN